MSQQADACWTRTPTVLVVDDSAVLRGLMQAILESGGYQVIQAANGLAAIQIAQTAHPDAVLMDVEMPVLSGTDACARLKTDPLTADIPVVIISARFPDGILESDAHLWAMADAYLSKPMRRATLLGCLDRVLGITRPDELSAATTDVDVPFLTGASPAALFPKS